MGEFELIDKYFKVPHARKDVVMGPGDDCALLTLPPDTQLAVSTDTLVSGVHFFPDMDPVDLGYKALAVNLSDLAAMGAEPRWVSLALTLPAINEGWVAGFAEGFLELAEYYNVALVGGDMTRGPLSITISVKGSVPAGRALMRSGAKAGDGIYVTGTLGDAALALSHLLGKRALNENQLAAVLPRLDHPHPRILAGQALRGLARQCAGYLRWPGLGSSSYPQGIRRASPDRSRSAAPLASAAGCGERAGGVATGTGRWR